MILLAIAQAWAEARDDGTSGGIQTPTAEVMQRGRTAVAVGATTEIASDGHTYGILPFGVGYSFGRNTEVGFKMDVFGTSLSDPSFAGTELGLRLRRRVLGTDGKTTPVVIEVAGTGFTGAWSAEADAVVGLRLASFEFHPSLGVSWTQDGGLLGRGTVSMAKYLKSSLRLLAEGEVRAGLVGIDTAEARLGLRVPLGRRVHLMAWGGGGVRQTAVLGGGGLTLLLYALDPRDVDRDGDMVADWKDQCPTEREDVDKFADYDGCPDPDNDGDGIPDAKDETPNGESSTPLSYSSSTPLLRMRIHERGLPGDDPDAP